MPIIFCKCNTAKVIDVGLRTSISTPTALLQMQIQEACQLEIAVRSFVFLKLPQERISFTKIKRTCGQLLDYQHILKTGRGMLPWGYNPSSGVLACMLFLPADQNMEAFQDQIKTIISSIQ